MEFVDPPPAIGMESEVLLEEGKAAGREAAQIGFSRTMADDPGVAADDVLVPVGQIMEFQFQMIGVVLQEQNEFLLGVPRVWISRDGFRGLDAAIFKDEIKGEQAFPF